jgi:hypothetical protein
MGTHRGDSVSIEIAPALQEKGMTPFDVMQSVATVEFITRPLPGLMFKLESPSYNLALGFTRENLYLVRNSARLELPVNITETAHYFVMWQPTELRVVGLDRTFGEALDSGANTAQEIERRSASCVTPATLPPNSLIEWARERLLLPIKTYRSIADFNQEVVFSLQSIQDKVNAINNLYTAFWNFSYGPEGKISARAPKQEPHIHPIIHGLLRDIAIAKSFKISSEYEIAGGDLDFLISGVLDTGKTKSVCIEFKNAHNPRLSPGLLKQLPSYMRAEGCDFGVYCVLWFKGADFAEPEHSDEIDLKLSLEREASSAGLLSIRVMIFDLSRPTPPSRL